MFTWALADGGCSRWLELEGPGWRASAWKWQIKLTARWEIFHQKSSWVWRQTHFVRMPASPEQSASRAPPLPRLHDLYLLDGIWLLHLLPLLPSVFLRDNFLLIKLLSHQRICSLHKRASIVLQLSCWGMAVCKLLHLGQDGVALSHQDIRHVVPEAILSFTSVCLLCVQNFPIVHLQTNILVYFK